MEQLNFFETTRKGYSKHGGPDMWVHQKKGKSGNTTRYVTINKDFIERERVPIELSDKSEYVSVAMSIESSAIVLRAGDTRINQRYITRFKKNHNGSISSFTSYNSRMVLEMFDRYLLDENISRHEFSLIEDGQYLGCPKYKIVPKTY